MASIPLAANALRTEQQNPLEGYERLVQLKSLLQNQQFQQQMQPLQQQQAQQATQAGELELQQKQRAAQDQQTVMQVFSQNQGDIKKSLPQLMGKVTPQTFMAVRDGYVKMYKENQEMEEKELALQKTRGDNLLGLIEQAKQLPPDQYAQQWPQIASRALEIEPKLKGHIDPAQPIPPQALGQYEIGLQSQSTMQAQELERRKADTGEWKDAGSGLLVNTRTGEKVQGAAPVEQQELSDFMRKHPGKGPADFVRFKAQNSPSVIVQGGVSGAAADPMVDMVGQGRVDLPTVTQRMAPPAKAAFMAQLAAKYPQYNQATYGVEKSVEKAFTSGTEGRNLTAFNTAIEHAKQLDSATNDLKNFDVRTMNKLANAYGVETGKDQVTNFNVIKNALVGEISKVFKGGQATDAEINHITGPFDAANSPAQLKGAIKQAIALMNSKRNALKQQYDMGKQGRPNFGEGEQAQPQGGSSDFFSQYGGKKLNQ